MLMAQTTTIEKFMQQAKDEMEQKRFSWYVLTKDIKSFSCEPCETIYNFWLRIDDGDGDFERIREYKTYLQEVCLLLLSLPHPPPTSPFRSTLATPGEAFRVPSL